MIGDEQGTLHAIRTRRVVRHFTSEPIAPEELREILIAARWAPTGGNRRVHRYVAILDPETIRLVRAVSPGISGRPTAMIVVCIDWGAVVRLGVKREHPTVYIDVGTATENMLLAAHVLGLGAGPVTSFNKGAVRVLLNIPDDVDPELIVCLGRSAPRESFHQSKPPEPTRLSTLVHWEHWKAAPDEGSSQKLS